MRDYISPAQLSCFSACPERYRRRYMLGEKRPPGVAMIVGGSVHAAAEANGRQKIESHEDLSVDDITNRAAQAYDDKLDEDGVVLMPEEKSRKSRVLGAGKDRAVKMSALYRRKVSPKIQPVMVEEKLRIELNDGLPDLLGIADVITDDNIVIDYKVVGRAINQERVDANLQLTAYGLCYNILYGKQPKVALEVMVSNGETQSLISERSEADYGKFIWRINLMVGMIDFFVNKIGTDNPWWPMDRSAWDSQSCSDRFCGFSADCPYYSHN